MEQLKSLDSLVLREKEKYSDIPENWKLKPLCCLSNISEEEVYYAVAKGSLGLAFFRESYAFTLYLLNKKGEQIFSLKKRAGIFTNKTEIFDSSENLIGSVERHGPSKTHFQALDPGGKVLYDLEGPSVSPETFYIRKGGMTLGKISKRPARRMEEEKFRNNHFGIIFPLDAEIVEKGVLLGALFLMDLTF